MVKCLPTMQETQVPPQGQEDPLEKEMAPHSSTLPGKSHGRRSVVGYSPWSRRESDMTERLHLLTSLSHRRRSSCRYSWILLRLDRGNSLSFLINLPFKFYYLSRTLPSMWWVCHTNLSSSRPKWTSSSFLYPSGVLFIPTLWVCDSPLHFFLPQSNSKSTPLILSTTQNTLSALTMLRSFLNPHSHSAVTTPLTKSSH